MRAEKKCQVLDIGVAHDAHFATNTVIDCEMGESLHQSCKATRVDKRIPFIIPDAHSLPFKEKYFDYIPTLHLHSHRGNRKLFCERLIKVGKRGYIEAPSRLCERLLADPVHKYFVYNEGGILVFEGKPNPTGTK